MRMGKRAWTAVTNGRLENLILTHINVLVWKRLVTKATTFSDSIATIVIN